MTSNKLKKILILIIILLVLLFLGIFFLYSPKAYSINESEYVNTKIKSSINGTKIAFISDINLNDEKSYKRFKSIINEFNEYPVDLVFFGGDLYEGNIFNSEEVSKLLKSIDCKYGKFAILGEKDTLNEIKVTSIFKEGGFEVLKEGVRPLYINNSSINLLIASENSNIKDFKLSEKTFNLALAHKPDTFNLLANKVDLQLSGHSYGGIIRIPFIGSVYKNEGAKTFNHGTYISGQSTLIVSNGISGPSSFPYKLGAKNEINIIKLMQK